MKRSQLTFPKGGVHPSEFKHLTAGLPVEALPLPKELCILMSQHFGAPATPVVKKKSDVGEGDVIGEMEAGLGARVHSGAAGKVKGIAKAPHPVSVSAEAVIIETDPQAPPRAYSPAPWEDLPRVELLSLIRSGGIVGLGGAGFPTHVKLAPPEEARVDTLILNGAECEPYLTNDHRLMLESPEKIVEGAKIILRILGLRECRIGIEENKSDAVETLSKVIGERASRNGFRISVDPLEVKYPQGSEKQLIQSLTGRRVPGFGLPFDVGVIVQNVGTAAAVYDAVVLKKPLYEKVVTISGLGIQRQANVLVKVGTRLSDVVCHLGGTTPQLSKVVMGGPMMGFSVSTLEVPVTKTTSGVLFLTDDEIDSTPYSPCIRCGWCLEACPMGLSPNEIGLYVEAGKAQETSQFGLFECFECGCCAFVCPAKRPLVQFIRLAKIKAKR